MPHGTEARQKSRLRFATMINAEAISIIALREVLRSITDQDTPEGIRQRIRDLIAVKSAAMGLDVQDFDSKLEESDAVIAAADVALQAALKPVRSAGGARQ